MNDYEMSKKIKIVYLIGQFGKGGSERQLYLLLKHMDLDLFSPYVIVFNPSNYSVYNDELLSLGIQVYEIPEDKKGIFNRIKFLFKIFKAVKPHIVHSWTLHDNPYAGIVGFLTGIPVRIGSLRASIKNRGFNKLSKLFRYLCLSSTQYLFVNADSILNELTSLKIPRNKIILLENCVEIQEKVTFPFGEELLGSDITVNKKIIASIGNITKNKNHHIFIQGLAKVNEDFPNIVGVILGQPFDFEQTYIKNLEKLIIDLGMTDKIILYGFHDNVPKLMHDIFIVCLLSDFEGTPNVILEAMAAGRPVIGTNVGGIPQIVKKEINGLLVDPGDVEGFAQALKRLLSDPDMAEEMGSAGKELAVSQHSCEEISRKLRNIYFSLVERS
ncbi:MAG TPA: hypothetical protein DCK95_05635 [Anaerolineaceae bacterium]|nr:hypothetical protein [Anaerolineaceae bacterium]